MSVQAWLDIMPTLSSPQGPQLNISTESWSLLPVGPRTVSSVPGTGTGQIYRREATSLGEEQIAPPKH
jgi:hypothetical protein